MEEQLGNDVTAAAAEALGSAAREQRLADYVTQSLEVIDPFEANVGVVNADLMLIAHRFRQVLGGALDKPPENLEELADFMPGVDGYLRIVKQLDRISQLALKLKVTNASL